MLKIKDKTPRYRIEYYRDDYNTLHQAIQIDLEEEKQSNGETTRFYRSQVNPNLTHFYKEIIVNKYYQVLKEEKIED